MNRNLKNIISLFSIEFIARLLGLLAVTYLARVLGKSNFGIINIGLAILSYATIVGNGGLTLLGTRKIAGKSDNIETLTGDILLSKIIFASIIFLVSVIAVYFLVESKTVIYTSIAYLFFLFPNAILLEWFFHGKQKMDFIAIGRITGSLSYFIFILIFVLNQADIILTGIGWVCGGIINATFLFIIFYKSKNTIKFNFKKLPFIQLIKESFSLGIGSIVAQFVVLFPIIYLGIVSSNSNAGIYSAAYKIIVMLLIVDRVFSALFFPKITQYYVTNPHNLKEMFNKILRIISVLGLSISLLAVVSGDLIVKLIFGEQYIESVFIFQILIVSFFFTLLSSVFTFTFIGINKENIFTNSLLIGSVIFLLSLIILTHLFGMEGSAFAYAIFEVSVFVILAFKLNKIITVDITRSILIPVLITAGILFAIMGIFKIDFSLQIIISIILGLPLIAWSGRIRIEEINFIKRIFI